ncbi:MAG: hypothetical protein IJ272_09765 [Clostridia bacterium]|nr:hypothetical protein [Clostridia bacterium]
MKTKKHGVSLIVLVITIIVMIILATTIILSLDDTGIIKKAQKAVDVTNEKEVQQLASVLWAEAYIEYGADEAKIQQYVVNGMTENGISTTEYGIIATTKGVSVSFIPEDWRGGNVVAVVDEVPIPKGFVASNATGENKKDTGLVIYEGTQAVDNANVEDARRTRNQYVWVPVATDEFETKFVRKFPSGYRTVSNTLGTGAWEVVLNTETNMPLTTQDSNYVTNTTQTGGITNTLAEVQAMYASVKKYGGFYIARYEMGIDTQRTSNTGLVATANVYSQMGKIPYNFVPWGTSMSNDAGGAVQVARSIYPVTDTTNTYGVVSTLTYGVQWDATVQWFLDSKALVDLNESKTRGNFKKVAIDSDDLNSGAKYAVVTGAAIGTYGTVNATDAKDEETMWALSTGALKVANINNVYDMAGNFHEWTMEGIYNYNNNGNHEHVVRGGYYLNDGLVATAFFAKTPNSAMNYITFRPSLYVK